MQFKHRNCDLIADVNIMAHQINSYFQTLHHLIPVKRHFQGRRNVQRIVMDGSKAGMRRSGFEPSMAAAPIHV